MVKSALIGSPSIHRERNHKKKERRLAAEPFKQHHPFAWPLTASMHTAQHGDEIAATVIMSLRDNATRAKAAVDALEVVVW